MGALEREANTKLVTATTDDAEVDLTQLTLPSETKEESWARGVLWWFAVLWWCYF